MKIKYIARFLQKEWILFFSLFWLAFTSFKIGHLSLLSLDEIKVILILAGLFVVVKGLENGGLFLGFARMAERGGFIPLKLVSASFFMSMLITNDVALIIIVPLTLVLKTDKKGILIIMEALAVNAGSALSPVGNPQNLFIYWFYGLSPLEFISVIAPFSLFFLIILTAGALMLKTSVTGSSDDEEEIRISESSVIYVILFILLLASVFKIIPAGIVVFIFLYALIFDRKALAVDYGLLLTFPVFFALSSNLKIMFNADIPSNEHVFLWSAFSSQIISNVPAALLFSKFTGDWQGLLWGVNAGGFGTLVGSMANLIAYRLYVNHESSGKVLRFTVLFTLLGFLFLFFSIILFYFLHG